MIYMRWWHRGKIINSFKEALGSNPCLVHYNYPSNFVIKILFKVFTFEILFLCSKSRLRHLSLNTVTPEPLTKSLATFGLGSNLQILVANWKNIPASFTDKEVF